MQKQELHCVQLYWHKTNEISEGNIIPDKPIADNPYEETGERKKQIEDR